MELYYEVGIIISWNHTIGIIPRRWNHCKEMESYHGIIPRTWNHTMGSYQGDGIIPWDHTKEMESYHGIIPRTWNHTMESSQEHGIIPYHTQRSSYNIHISKQVYSK
jgi:hypothetical protein